MFCFALLLLHRTKDSLGVPILSSIWRLIRYHLGSVALGSFIIAVIKFLRAIMYYVEKRLKSQSGGGGPVNSVALGFLKCCKCCLWCFEKILQYLNKNAYIEIGKRDPAVDTWISPPPRP